MEYGKWKCHPTNLEIIFVETNRSSYDSYGFGSKHANTYLKKNILNQGGCINIPAILMLGVPGFDPEPYFIVLVSMIYIYIDILYSMNII